MHVVTPSIQSLTTLIYQSVYCFHGLTLWYITQTKQYYNLYFIVLLILLHQ